MSFIQNTGNKISTANSTTALLGAGATFTGAWEDAINYTSISVSVLGTNATDGIIWFDVRKTGSTIVNSVPFFRTDITGNPTNIPSIWNIVESEFRIRYVNGTTAQLTEWYLETKLSNGQQSDLLSVAGASINSNTPVSTVKSVVTGVNSNGVYIDTPAAGVDDGNSTNALLGISGVFTGAWVRVAEFGEIKVALHSDVESDSCLYQLSHDGIVIDTSLSIPPQFNGSDWTSIHALNPSLPYFRIVYTNGPVAQTDFSLTTTLLVNSGAGFVSRTTQTIDKFTDARVVRVANDPTLDRNLGLLNYQEAIRKFGKNNSVANSAFETVWAGADLGGATVYVFPTTAENLRVKAGGNVADTALGTGARTIRVTGISDTYTEITEEITLAGASASASTTALFRAVNRVEVITTGTYAGANTGIIIVENDTTNLELAYVPVGLGITQQSIYTVPAGKTAYISKIRVSIGLSDSADVRLIHIDNIDDNTAPFTSVKQFEWGIEDYSGSRDFDLDTYLKFEEKNHIFFEAQRVTGSGTAQVSVDFEMYLIDN